MAAIANRHDFENEEQENIERPWQRGGSLQHTPENIPPSLILPDHQPAIARAQVAQYLPFVGNSHPKEDSDSEPDTPAEPEVPRRFSYRTAIRRWLLRMLGRVLDVLDFIIDAKYSPILLGIVVVTMAYVGGGMLSQYMSEDSWGESYDVFPETANSGPSESFTLPSLNWYGWNLSAWSWNLAQLVPLWLARPSTIFSGDDAVEYQRRLREIEFELQNLKTSNSFHRSSLDKLANIVPAVVYMDLDRNNRPVVNEAFYHALRDLMKADRELVTLQRGSHGYYDVSDETWMAVKTRLAREKHLFTPNQTTQPAPSLSRGEVDRIVESQVPKSWADWAKRNRDKVAEILGPVLNPAAPLSSDDVMKKVTADVEKQLEKSAIEYANQAIRNASGGGALLTRGEFLSHLKSEFLTYRNEIRAETEGILKSNLTSYIHDMLERAANYHPGESSPSSSSTGGGVTRVEVLQIVDAEIRNAVSRAGLRAFAEGKISATWDHDLRQRVNFFARGNGAVIDATHTSPNFEVKGTGHYDDNGLHEDSGGRKGWIRSSANSLRSPRIMQPYVALLDWRNAGECWCGSLTQTRFKLPYGVSLSIELGHRVIPEYIVVEHILPGATLYPDARPKDIEVWAYIDDAAQREVAQDFSQAHFALPSSSRPRDAAAASPGVADRRAARPFREEGWVKIGQFEYESREATNGVYVHRLNPALQEMRIETDHIILRATSNYGQKDHTCFYRVRMYGEAVKGLPLKPT
ncbi:hypothetical protein ACRALDRAFT_1059836 [Sodiomyces alcalophilus JCM 7366]|uniref:uncharacterized protein n=1 Tax=Sodiomyces alcalophilus JCM 7366 TaxID=591952 RepID=UPI0039B3C7FB